MISLCRLKRLLAAVAWFAGLGAVLVVLLLITVVVVRVGTGADPSDAFTEAPLVPEDIDGLVEWRPDAPGLLRSVEPDTRAALAATWVRGLAAVDRRDERAVSTWFASGALSRHQDLLAGPAPIIERTWSRHVVRVEFYSLDGQVTALDLASHGVMQHNGGQLVVEERHQVVMVLRDGNWR
ncbi:MAG: hypothetical protein OES57_12175, partial [Acidimicrobiia bacterium]|nr:hypothetical protein [Acidimicrobiia bacterium]